MNVMKKNQSQNVETGKTAPTSRNRNKSGKHNLNLTITRKDKDMSN